MDQQSAVATRNEDNETGRWAELFESRYAATTTMLCIGIALYAFNGFLVSTALPSAVDELGGAAVISWSLSLYLAASIVSGAAAALIKQRFGGRATLIGAALVFLAGTVAAILAEHMSVILLGRVFQGVGEGVVAAICYALIPEMYPRRLVPKVFGAEATVWAVAGFGGPVVSGFLTESFSWRAAFAVNLPVVVIFVLLVAVIVPRKAGDRTPTTFPAARLLLLSASLMLAMLAGIAPTLPSALALLALTAAAVAGTLRLDRRADHRILPHGAFSFHTTLGLGLWVVLMMPLAQATSSVYLVYSLQNLWGFSATAAGALSALMALSWSASAILIANLQSPGHQQRAIWLGPLLHVAGLAGLFAGIANGSLLMVVAAQVLIGCGFGLNWGFLSQTLMTVSPASERDKTSVLLPTLHSAGFAFGGALAGLAANAAGLADAVAPQAMHGPLSIAFLCAVFWALPALFAARRAMSPGMLAAARA